MKLKLLEQAYVLLRYPSDTDISKLRNNDNEFFSLTKTPQELSLFCEETKIPELQPQKVEAGWRGLYIDEVLEFSDIGVIKKMSEPLAATEISILALSTFDTDYVFVQSRHLNQAITELHKAGFTW